MQVLSRKLRFLSCEDIGRNRGVGVIVAGSNNNLSVSLMHSYVHDSCRTRPFEREENPGAMEGAALKLRCTRTIGAHGGAETGAAFEGFNQFVVCFGKCHIRVVLLLITLLL